ncbi:hypothetical protein [Enterocloster clostridioformis]|jgi:hypothetical protein|uniref:Uncharacterized protein n=1 Tax=Enterocloster clostridioformis TaxID=1531 RepID=A0A829VUU2_9FIRM|nr:hypothetical protein [Enterocloster clostridioformis]EHG33537.1 hypothetical protein HMPREF9467_00742 [ [[Clostridium] clostridioforme 2_1_49FAA]ENZ28764.1 hypothetical protein HMPREF1087_01260 [[Clostridium] clostridioforme 90A1]ENZ72413.1 hypothetical protein HMPREF1081_00828 [[Clostridium] clostridioforme 90A4]QIX93872.1 hypothetical protein FOC47_27015 [Enterocloster clostridioformis]GEA37652.1 hypothetical protein Ccl03g_33650 [Enterocloster clostridioformis]
MLTKEQEKILTFLLSLPRDTNNRITVSRKNYNLDYSESDFITKLRDIETLGYFEIKYLTGHHNTLKTYIEVIPNGNTLSYFMDKKNKESQKRRDLIKWLIPVIISSLSLLWNILNTLYSTHLKELIDNLTSQIN